MKKQLLLILSVLFLTTLNAQVVGYTSSLTYLRSGPSNSSKAVIEIPQGTKINLSRQYYEEWIPINYNGQDLFLYSGFLTTPESGVNKIYNNQTTPENSTKSGSRYYYNSQGERVQSPTHYSSKPRGASAKCKDGTYSFSRSRRGTCSGHGGVAQWY